MGSTQTADSVHAIISSVPARITGRYRIIIYSMDERVLVKNGEFQPLDEFAAETMQIHLRASIQPIEDEDGSFLRAKVLAARWDQGAFDLEVEQGVPALDDDGEETVRVERSTVSYADISIA